MMQIHLTTARKSLPPILAVGAVAGLAWRQGRRRTAAPIQSATRFDSAPDTPPAPARRLGQFEQRPESQQVTGVIGPGADAYLRTMLVHLLTRAAGTTRVVITADDLDRLFEGRFDVALRSTFDEQLHVAPLLEDAIEHLETEAERREAGPNATDPHNRTSMPTIYWLASPGADSDVVQQTIQLWNGLSLIALLSGPWPYGPTRHLADDRRPSISAPDDPLQYLTPEQAIDVLLRVPARR